MRDEQRRLKQLDQRNNVERMYRASAYRNAELQSKFAQQDAREAARKQAIRSMVERYPGLAPSPPLPLTPALAPSRTQTLAPTLRLSLSPTRSSATDWLHSPRPSRSSAC